jgi:hypothetical protein
VQHAVGSLDNPLSDARLDDKVHDLLRERRGTDSARLREQVFRLANLTDVRPLCERFLRES